MALLTDLSAVDCVGQGEGGSFSAELMVEKQMEVCKVCGAFLIVGDAPARLDHHMPGKQHVGYQKLRNSVEEITVRPDAPSTCCRRRSRLVFFRFFLRGDRLRLLRSKLEVDLEGDWIGSLF